MRMRRREEALHWSSCIWEGVQPVFTFYSPDFSGSKQKVVASLWPPSSSHLSYLSCQHAAEVWAVWRKFSKDSQDFYMLLLHMKLKKSIRCGRCVYGPPIVYVLWQFYGCRVYGFRLCVIERVEQTNKDNTLVQGVFLWPLCVISFGQCCQISREKQASGPMNTSPKQATSPFMVKKKKKKKRET